MDSVLRILKKKKERKNVTIRMDVDLYAVLDEKNLPLSDIVNLALEKWLRDKGFIK